ncbi:DUF1338-domain-containing protein [Thozetella sp. PMI_491]|nr:DUF1338-domain-containing protein [Thozetella sp. PMI_491]
MGSNETVGPDRLRAMFASALSNMYQREVPQYGTLLELVSDVNQRQSQQNDYGPGSRIEVERHGAIRLGTASELHTMRRLFSVMGMQPVGYYDLTVAGLPVHATCFRPLSRESLAVNPFRVFTSLLRLELIQDDTLRARATEILAARQIFTPRCIEMIGELESCRSMPAEVAKEFLAEALETFRWHKASTVDMTTYRALQAEHPLIADVVCFKGPHINHLTPRVLDIEAAQAEMQKRGLQAKQEIEGPPPMQNLVLLRQTSFLALEEEIDFSDGAEKGGRHKARFGEIEQRGIALTPKGRHLYDDLIARFRSITSVGHPTQEALRECFRNLPDDLNTLRRERLAYFTYSLVQPATEMDVPGSADALVDAGILAFKPITYEDFLPVSAAGIFHSNLGSHGISTSLASPDQASFERALGSSVMNEFELYEKMEKDSYTECLERPLCQ